MNGIDPVVLATGNDWRAIEAGAHAFAAQSGRYSSLTKWEIDAENQLVGTIELPMALGLVGGATKTHPAAQVALKMLNVDSASELAIVVACVGLAQNMAALRALATEGIQKGHMALHARNIAIVAGAEGGDIERVAREIVALGDVSVDAAKRVLSLGVSGPKWAVAMRMKTSSKISKYGAKKAQFCSRVKAAIKGRACGLFAR